MSFEMVLTVVGNVVNDPQHRPNASRPFTSFRVARDQRRWDPEARQFVDDEPAYVSVTAHGELGRNALASVHKGQRVVVHGRVRIVEWKLEGQQRSGTNIEIVASTLGHDLQWGTSVFTRTSRAQRRPHDDRESAAMVVAMEIGDDGLDPSMIDLGDLGGSEVGGRREVTAVRDVTSLVEVGELSGAETAVLAADGAEALAEGAASLESVPGPRSEPAAGPTRVGAKGGSRGR